MAPYFLHVKAFWEDPSNHDNEEYCLKDCEYTYKLYYKFTEMASDKEFKFYYDSLLPQTKMLLDSEIRGIRLALAKLDTKQQEAQTRMEANEKALIEGWTEGIAHYAENEMKKIDGKYNELFFKAANKAKDKDKCVERYNSLQSTAYSKLQDLNLNSPKQLAWLLRDFLGYDITTTVTIKNQSVIKDSTNTEVLERLSAQEKKFMPELLQYKKDRKLCTAFFPSYKKLQHHGIIHSNFNPTGTITGRLSSSGPNLQQIPADLHDLYIARDGRKLITYDMSAIEPRLIAYYTDCPILFDVFDKGLDFHGINTKIFFGLDCDASEVKKLHPKERKVGKEVGLALFYGAGAKRLQQSALKHGYIWTEQECREKVDYFRQTYSKVFSFKQEWDYLMEHKDFMPNLFGRPIAVQDSYRIHMTGFNKLIQSSGTDMLLKSAYDLTNAFKERDIDAYPLLYIHDELVVECPANMTDICAELQQHHMTNYKLMGKHGRIAITVEGKVGDSWVK